MVKYVLGWLVVFAIRLIPFRPPNVEPLMAMLMPYSKKYGWLGGFIFAFLGIVFFDVATGKVGLWTWITGGMYGLIGVGAYFYFRNRTASAKNFIIYSIFGTLVFDAITGVAMGPLFFHQPFMEALMGQIPFTFKHLLGNLVLALFVSPAIYRWVVENPKLATRPLWNLLANHARMG